MTDRLESLRQQIAEKEKNLTLIQEQRSKYVMDEDIPLQLRKNEEELKAQLDDLRTQVKKLEKSVQPKLAIRFLPQHIPFTNREDEIGLILSSFAPAYHLLDAPSGYGKTGLLKELERRFREPDKNWDCVYVSVNEKSTLTDLVTALAGKLEVSLSQHSELPWHLRLGGPLQNQWRDSIKRNTTKEGLALLIDLEGRPSLLIVQELLEKLIPAVHGSLRNLEFFASKHNRFRVVLAGRHLAASQVIKTASIPITILSLKSFDYLVIQNSARGYLVGHDENSINQISAHLFYLTAGHPGCMAQILSMYRDEGISPDDFLTYFNQKIWETVVREIVNDIREELTKSTPELGNVLDRLCVFRYVDSAILEYILKDSRLSGINSPYELADKLTATYLFAWKGRFLRDNITRGLLAIRLRHDKPNEFRRRCQEARDMCENRLQQENVQGPEKWMIEYLFQNLQEYAENIQDPIQRNEVRKIFFNQVNVALRMFIDQQNKPLTKKWEEYIVLTQAMDADWEFCFTVNYYLRKDQYTNEPYTTLRKQIDDFFTQN